MKIAEPLLEQLKEALAELASRVTGFRSDSLRLGAIEKIIQEESTRGVSAEALAKKIELGFPELSQRLAEAVPVGETYFFRQPEHFRYLEEKILPSRPPGPLKVWSAGCATGEEAYSLAAFLSQTLTGAPEETGVLGTDLSAKHLEIARKGVYGSWSLRGSGEESYPVFEERSPTSLLVKRELRERVRFISHNLLYPLPEEEGPFDLVFCRNVLVYFTPEAAEAALRNLVASLAPEGLLFLGPTDVPHTPAGLKVFGPAELTIYRKKSPAPAKPAAEPPPDAPVPQRTPRLSAPPAPETRTPVDARPRGTGGPSALHFKILEAMENGGAEEAGRLLGDLCRRFPDYLPGLYEAALWNARNKRKAAAEGLMREILNRLKGRGGREIVAGPLALTVGFYRASARTFLRGKETK